MFLTIEYTQANFIYSLIYSLLLSCWEAKEKEKERGKKLVNKLSNTDFQINSNEQVNTGLQQELANLLFRAL